jgi:hypothetical protein
MSSKKSLDRNSSSIVILKQISTQILMSRMFRLLRIFISLILVLENKTTAIIKTTNDVIEVYVIEYYEMSYMNQFQSNKWWFSMMMMIRSDFDDFHDFTACHRSTAFPD